MHIHRTAGVPPNYLAWREQRKLLLWVLLIGVPVIVVLRIWDFWRAVPQQPVVERANIDPRLPDSSPSLAALDSFTAEPEHREADAQANRKDERYFRGVIPAYLDSVRDDTPSRVADHDACFNLLQTLQGADAAALKAASLGPTTYVQLFRQPDAYRARLVDLRGTVRRVEEHLPLAKNHTGLTEYHRLWLSSPDNPENPIIVYVLDLPGGFPTGAKTHEPVELTGFFFKRVAYSAAGGGMTAPMVLAKSVQWKAASPQEQAANVAKSRARMLWLIAIAVVGSIALVGAMWQLNRSMRRPLVKRAEMTADSADALRDADAPSVQEELQRLAREDI